VVATRELWDTRCPSKLPRGDVLMNTHMWTRMRHTDPTVNGAQIADCPSGVCAHRCAYHVLTMVRLMHPVVVAVVAGAAMCQDCVRNFVCSNVGSVYTMIVSQPSLSVAVLVGALLMYAWLHFRAVRWKSGVDLARVFATRGGMKPLTPRRVVSVVAAASSCGGCSHDSRFVIGWCWCCFVPANGGLFLACEWLGVCLTSWCVLGHNHTPTHRGS